MIFGALLKYATKSSLIFLSVGTKLFFVNVYAIPIKKIRKGAKNVRLQGNAAECMGRQEETAALLQPPASMC